MGFNLQWNFGRQFSYLWSGLYLFKLFFNIFEIIKLLWSWALPPIFFYFLPFISVLSVTRSPLVPLCTAWTATGSPDKSPDGPPDHSALRYHMPSLRSPQHSAASPLNPLWIASSLPRHDRPPAHDGAILRTASSWWTLLYVTVLFCDSCDPLLLTCI